MQEYDPEPDGADTVIVAVVGTTATRPAATSMAPASLRVVDPVFFTTSVDSGVDPTIATAAVVAFAVTLAAIVGDGARCSESVPT